MDARKRHAILLAIILWTAILRVPAIYAYYILDTSDFIERLCENKDKPKMNCNGKCYLSKMLQADQQAEDEPAMPMVSWSEFQFLPVRVTAPDSWNLFKPFTQVPPYRNGYAFAHASKCFRPPPDRCV